LAYFQQGAALGWVWAMVPLAVFLLRWHNLAAVLCLSLLLFGIGWWRGSAVMQQLRPYTELKLQKVLVVGRATEDGVYGRRSQLTFGLDQLQVAAPYRVELPGSIKVAGFGAPAVYRGDVVQVSGKLYPTRGNHRASVSFAELTVLRSEPSAIENFRRSFAAGMQSALPEPQASFGMGLLIGQRSTLPEHVSEALLMVGLTHIIAVSGYNLTIMVEVARRIFGSRSKFQTAAACLPLIATFLLITGSSPSIVRASIISVLSIGAWYYGRTIKPLVLLLTAAAITVLANPMYLWGNVSWYLSFLAFFGVIVLAPLAVKRLFGERQPRLVTLIIIESLCAEVMTLPYVLFIFGQLSLVSLLANVLVATLVPLAMLLGVIAGAAGLLIPWLAGWFAWPAKLLLGYMLDMAGLLSHVPYAFLKNIGFGFHLLCLVYCLIAFITAILHGKNQRKYAIITGKK
jgi:competence protein ComEC